MLMHHSRNSEQKQWDETLVLALSGMGRLFRAHLPLLVPMQAFPQVWASSPTLMLTDATSLRPTCPPPLAIPMLTFIGLHAKEELWQYTVASCFSGMLCLLYVFSPGMMNLASLPSCLLTFMCFHGITNMHDHAEMRNVWCIRHTPRFADTCLPKLASFLPCGSQRQALARMPAALDARSLLQCKNHDSNTE